MLAVLKLANAYCLVDASSQLVLAIFAPATQLMTWRAHCPRVCVLAGGACGPAAVIDPTGTMAVWFEAVAVLVFFVAYLAGGVYVAAGTAVVLALLQVAYVVLWRRQPLSMLNALGAGLIVVFGTLTIIFHDDMFIKIKPTLLYWILVAVLLVTRWRARRTGGPYIVQQMLPARKDLKITDPAVWRACDVAWAAFFFMLGAANLVFALTVTTDAWVNIKVFCFTPVLLVAAIAQTCVLQAYNEYDIMAELAAEQQRRRRAELGGDGEEGILAAEAEAAAATATVDGGTTGGAGRSATPPSRPGSAAGKDRFVGMDYDDEEDLAASRSRPTDALLP